MGTSSSKIKSEELLGNPKVLNTAIGAKLIDDLSKINPEKACACMMKAYAGAKDVELKKVRANRRDLCWTLSRLCFNNGTFENAAFLMLRFAQTEREEDIGKARIGLQKLFFPRLGATEADLKRRIAFIGECLGKDENIGLTLKVLECGVSFQVSFFHDGTEKLADREMEPYVPNTDELQEYVAAIIDRLGGLSTDQREDVREKALNILGGHFIELCRIGLCEVTMPAIERACEVKGYRWDNLLDSLLLFKDEMMHDLNEGMSARYDALIKKLSKDDFEFRFKRVEKELYNGAMRLSAEKMMNEQRERYKVLAEEFLGQGLMSVELLAKLYQAEVISTSPFGEVVAKGLNEEQKRVFVSESVGILNGREKAQTDILIDFTVGLDEKEFDGAFSMMLGLKNKRPLFAAVARRSTTFNCDYMDVLLELVRKGEAQADLFVTFWSNFWFAYMEDGDIATWLNHVRELPGGTETVLHILQSAINGEAYKKNTKTVGVALDTVMTMNVDYSTIMSYYQYWNVVRLLLGKDRYPELARNINNVLLEYIKSQDSFLINNYEVKQTYRQLLGDYFDDVWGELSDVLLSEGKDYWTYHRLKDIMGSMIGGAYNEVGLLFEKDHTEVLLEWCRKNPNIAPERLMDMAPVFGEGGVFSKIVYALIEEFGQNVKVLHALEHNMECFGWVGSVIPLYQKELRAVETLKDHRYGEVRTWSARMAAYLEGEMEKEKGNK